MIPYGKILNYLSKFHEGRGLSEEFQDMHRDKNPEGWHLSVTGVYALRLRGWLQTQRSVSTPVKLRLEDILVMRLGLSAVNQVNKFIIQDFDLDLGWDSTA